MPRSPFGDATRPSPDPSEAASPACASSAGEVFGDLLVHEAIRGVVGVVAPPIEGDRGGKAGLLTVIIPRDVFNDQFRSGGLVHRAASASKASTSVFASR
ncbi:hypothetical protein WR25_15783 [Diploscapter pachys]|uniref:Uncharacterized protein n=1 Tax=Diploscapter pachys TaxID=2018661 RepID=A0A2A2JXR5_9BILA|nr:hypothetical protein WR25_15783 [Diploscapter pachys]